MLCADPLFPSPPFSMLSIVMDSLDRAILLVSSVVKNSPVLLLTCLKGLLAIALLKFNRGIFCLGVSQ